MVYYQAVEDKEVQALVATYFKEYEHDAALEQTGTEAYAKVWNSAKAEIALRRLLKDTGAKGFTTNFNDLGLFDQIPGLASQRLMAEGYGFGAEGDWKTAALYRTTWFMSQGLPKGCSFLEDYTLHFDGEKSAILQAHMLEVCPLIAEQKPRLEVHRLSIGIDSETARLVFTSKELLLLSWIWVTVSVSLSMWWIVSRVKNYLNFPLLRLCGYRNRIWKSVQVPGFWQEVRIIPVFRMT